VVNGTKSYRLACSKEFRIAHATSGKQFAVFARHRGIDHARSYAMGDLHTNTIEGAFSLLKRGVYGTFHKVSIKRLGRYCNEFSYRFNRRGEQLAMFDATLKNLTRGEALPYNKLTAKDLPNV
jgi:ISXO2-like transposase domain